MKYHNLSQLSEEEKIQRILELEACVEALEANPSSGMNLIANKCWQGFRSIFLCKSL